MEMETEQSFSFQQIGTEKVSTSEGRSFDPREPFAFLQSVEPKFWMNGK